MPEFLPIDRELTIGEIVALTRAKPRADVPLDRRISNIAPLDTARDRDITFIDNAKYLDALAITRAGACLVMPRFEAEGAGSARRAGHARALSGLRRRGASAVSVGAAAFLAVRRERARGRRARASLGADRGGRHHRSAGGDRTRRRDWGRHADRGRRRRSGRTSRSDATAQSAPAPPLFMRLSATA